MKKVFINNRKLSDEASKLLQILYPYGGLVAEDKILNDLRKLKHTDLSKDSKVSLTEVKQEIAKLVYEEVQVEVLIEGQDSINKVVPFEEEHEKAIAKLKEIAKQEELELAKKEEAVKEIEAPIEEKVVKEEVKVEQPKVETKKSKKKKNKKK